MRVYDGRFLHVYARCWGWYDSYVRLRVVFNSNHIINVLNLFKQSRRQMIAKGQANIQPLCFAYTCVCLVIMLDTAGVWMNLLLHNRPQAQVHYKQGNQRWQTSPAAPPVCVPNFIVIGWEMTELWRRIHGNCEKWDLSQFHMGGPNFDTESRISTTIRSRDMAK